MTQYRCWVTFETDRALQAKVANGWYGAKGEEYLPIQSFPAASDDCWPLWIKTWSESRGVHITRVDGLTLFAKVKQPQLADFIEYVYGSDSSYTDPAKMLTWHGRAYLAGELINLRAFVAKDLNPRLWYKLYADEF